MAMPNWCMNELTVSGETEQIEAFVKANIGFPAKYPPIVLEDGTVLFEQAEYDTPYFSFNAMVPTPEEVLEIGFDGRNKIPRINQLCALNGHTIYPIDGYHWNIANWGTKWDVYGDKITAKEMGWHKGAESISFIFNTAWSPPNKWFYAVAERFPDLSFVMHYEEPGCCFAGDYYAENGVCWCDEYNKDRCKSLFCI